MSYSYKTHLTRKCKTYICYIICLIFVCHNIGFLVENALECTILSVRFQNFPEENLGPPLKTTMLRMVLADGQQPCAGFQCDQPSPWLRFHPGENPEVGSNVIIWKQLIYMYLYKLCSFPRSYVEQVVQICQVSWYAQTYSAVFNYQPEYN